MALGRSVRDPPHDLSFVLNPTAEKQKKDLKFRTRGSMIDMDKQEVVRKSFGNAHLDMRDCFDETKPVKLQRIRFPAVRPFYTYSMDPVRHLNNAKSVPEFGMQADFKRLEVTTFLVDSNLGRLHSQMSAAKLGECKHSSVDLAKVHHAQNKLVSKRQPVLSDFAKDLPRDDRFWEVRPGSRDPESRSSPRHIERAIAPLFKSNFKISKLYDMDYLRKQVEKFKENRKGPLGPGSLSLEEKILNGNFRPNFRKVYFI